MWFFRWEKYKGVKTATIVSISGVLLRYVGIILLKNFYILSLILLCVGVGLHYLAEEI